MIPRLVRFVEIPKIANARFGVCVERVSILDSSKKLGQFLLGDRGCMRGATSNLH